jgi:hypothetical protein
MTSIPLLWKGIEAIVFRTVNEQPTLWEGVLPSEHGVELGNPMMQHNQRRQLNGSSAEPSAHHGQSPPTAAMPRIRRPRPAPAAGTAFSPATSSRSAPRPDASKPHATGHPDMSSPLTATIPAEPFQVLVARFLCAGFLCPAGPGVVPRQLTGRRVAFPLETIAELRSLNLRRS